MRENEIERDEGIARLVEMARAVGIARADRIRKAIFISMLMERAIVEAMVRSRMRDGFGSARKGGWGEGEGYEEGC